MPVMTGMPISTILKPERPRSILTARGTPWKNRAELRVHLVVERLEQSRLLRNRFRPNSRHGKKEILDPRQHPRVRRAGVAVLKTPAAVVEKEAGVAAKAVVAEVREVVEDEVVAVVDDVAEKWIRIDFEGGIQLVTILLVCIVLICTSAFVSRCIWFT